MTRRRLIHQQAKDDLTNHYAYIARNEPEAADRLLAAVQKLFDDLAHFPDMGRRWQSEAAHLQEIRFLPIHGFLNYLVFYHTTASDVRIITVLHGSRDLPALLRMIDRSTS